MGNAARTVVERLLMRVRNGAHSGKSNGRTDARRKVNDRNSAKNRGRRSRNAKSNVNVKNRGRNGVRLKIRSGAISAKISDSPSVRTGAMIVSSVPNVRSVNKFSGLNVNNSNDSVRMLASMTAAKIGAVSDRKTDAMPDRMYANMIAATPGRTPVNMSVVTHVRGSTTVHRVTRRGGLVGIVGGHVIM